MDPLSVKIHISSIFFPLVRFYYYLDFQQAQSLQCLAHRNYLQYFSCLSHPLKHFLNSDCLYSTETNHLGSKEYSVSHKELYFVFKPVCWDSNCYDQG